MLPNAKKGLLTVLRESLGVALPRVGGGHHPNQAFSLIGPGGERGELEGGSRKP